MKHAQVGDFRLDLFGLPPSNDSLLLSILQQLAPVNPLPPTLESLTHQVPHFQVSVSNFLRQLDRPIEANHFSSANFVGSLRDIGPICQYLNVNIEVFMDDAHRRTYPAACINPPTLRIYQYYLGLNYYFDGLVDYRSSPLKQLRIGTWNLLGATSLEKRLIVDEFSRQHQLDVLCIQESHLYTQLLETPRYKWMLGPQQPGRASRGCGFLINKQLDIAPEFKIYSANLCHLALTLPKVSKVHFILCVHRLSEGNPGSSIEAGHLLSIIRNLMTIGEVLVCGDFNSHLGKELLQSEQTSIGPILCHQVSNSNGNILFDLCQQLDLHVSTTSHHHSTLTTWYRSSGVSQIDHVIVPTLASYQIKNLRGHWTRYSDHKLLVFVMLMPLSGEIKGKISGPSGINY